MPLNIIRIWRVVGEHTKVHPGMTQLTLGTFGSEKEAEDYLAKCPSSPMLEKFLLVNNIESLRVSVYEHSYET